MNSCTAEYAIYVQALKYGMGLLETVGDVLKTDSAHIEGVREAKREGIETEDAETGVRPRLYRCSSCDTTYVTLKMEMCPDCGVPLEDIPNERDLGMT